MKNLEGVQVGDKVVHFRNGLGILIPNSFFPLYHDPYFIRQRNKLPVSRIGRKGCP